MILKMKNKKKKVKEIVYPASWNFKIYKYKAHSNRNLPFSFSTSFIPKASVLIFLQTKQPFFSVLSHRKTRQISLSRSLPVWKLWMWNTSWIFQYLIAYNLGFWIFKWSIAFLIWENKKESNSLLFMFM